jgi:hypothetical protein
MPCRVAELLVPRPGLVYFISFFILHLFKVDKNNRSGRHSMVHALEKPSFEEVKGGKLDYLIDTTP